MSDYAWHLLAVGPSGPRYRDGKPAKLGKTLEHGGPVTICRSGLHASWRALDALCYAPGGALQACFVEVADIVTEHADKFVCRRRRIVAWAPADEALRIFARHAASSVLHLWDAPPIVREYLETGDETIRDAAQTAARAAASGATAEASASSVGACAAVGATARDSVGAAAGAAVWAAGVSTWPAGGGLNAELESMLLGQMEWA